MSSLRAARLVGASEQSLSPSARRRLPPPQTKPDTPSGGQVRATCVHLILAVGKLMPPPPPPPNYKEEETIRISRGGGGSLFSFSSRRFSSS